MKPNTARRARSANAPALIWREARPSVQLIVQLRYWSAVVLAGGGFGVRPALGSLFLLLAYCAVYVLNGVADIAEDRGNRSRRPIASGAIAPRDRFPRSSAMSATPLST